MDDLRRGLRVSTCLIQVASKRRVYEPVRTAHEQQKKLKGRPGAMWNRRIDFPDFAVDSEDCRRRSAFVVLGHSRSTGVGANGSPSHEPRS